MPPIDLHLVSWNRPKMTELVIRTIHRNKGTVRFILQVLDNGSDKPTVAMLRRLMGEGLISYVDFRDRNIGLEAARQELFLKRSRTPYFVDIDNDCLPPKHWLDTQLALMKSHPDYAAISQRTQVMIGTGNIFEEADKNGYDLVDFPHPGGSFRMMQALAVKRVGGWDRDMAGRGQEERYIGGKLREAGYKTAFAAQLQCLHLFGVREQTKERWGYDEQMQPEDSGHSDIWHPALTNGDDYETVKLYAGEALAKEYFRA